MHSQAILVENATGSGSSLSLNAILNSPGAVCKMYEYNVVAISSAFVTLNSKCPEKLQRRRNKVREIWIHKFNKKCNKVSHSYDLLLNHIRMQASSVSRISTCDMTSLPGSHILMREHTYVAIGNDTWLVMKVSYTHAT